MRLKGISIACCLIAIAAVITVPIFWQANYHARLVHAVPLGSTRDEYLKALLDDRLGQGIPRPHPGYTFWRPFQWHGFIYTIVAEPEWGVGGHLSGYNLYSKISLRGHAFYLSRSPGPL